VRNFHNNHTLVVRRALEIMESESGGELTVERVAASVGLSPNYFSHLFKRVRGQGFKDHLNALRIEKAQKLLAVGGRRVYEVARAVGFSDYKYFSAVFKKITGRSPTRYR
jgi:two-component system, response regulator YesN